MFRIEYPVRWQTHHIAKILRIKLVVCPLRMVRNMKIFLALILWGLLLVVCWPLALLLLILFPFVWLLCLPFRIIGFSLDLIFKLISGILLLPFRAFR